MTTTVQCPTCNKPVRWVSDNKFRPFCSERCQLIDLGEWADGNRSIPSTENDVTASDLDRD